jgi:hypothetical protein
MPFTNVISNIGGYFNGNNGLFTAPYTGTYIFFGISYANVNQSQSWLVVNGGRSAGTDCVKSSASAFTYAHWIIRLSANDTCGFHPYNGNASGTFYNNPFHNCFKGYFLG